MATLLRCDVKSIGVTNYADDAFFNIFYAYLLFTIANSIFAFVFTPLHFSAYTLQQKELQFDIFEAYLPVFSLL